MAILKGPKVTEKDTVHFWLPFWFRSTLFMLTTVMRSSVEEASAATMRL